METEEDDQAALVDALDRWFAILREGFNAKVPLKPARPSQLDQLANVLEVELPPDAVTFFEYTNGAWLDDDHVFGSHFFPFYKEFEPLPDTIEDWSFYRQGSLSRGFREAAVEYDRGFRDNVYADMPGVEWANDVPILTTDMEQITIQAGKRAFQACAGINIEGMFWVERRLVDLFERAIASVEQGEIQLEGPSEYPEWVVDPKYSSVHTPVHVPWDFERYVSDDGVFHYPGWIWEDLPPI